MPRKSSRGQAVPDKIDKYVGGRLRAQRVLKGLSQSQLAAMVDLTFQQVQKYETGTNRIAASRLYKFARVLGVDVTYFFDGLDGDLQDAEPEAKEALPLHALRAYTKLASLENREIHDAVVALVKALLKDAEK